MDVRAVERAAQNDPDWRAEQRRAAWAQFEVLGRPDPKAEEWRYVELDFDLADYQLVDAPGTPEPAPLGAFEPVHQISVTDGIATGAVLDGPVWAGPFGEAARARPEAFAAVSGKGIPASLDQFSAAHQAFGGDGVLVHAKRGTVGGPVLIDVQATTSGIVSFPKVVVVADEASQVSVVVHMSSTTGTEALVVPQVEVVAGAAANAHVTVIQNLGRTMRSIGHVRSNVGRDARVVVAEAGLGAVFSRWHLTVDLEGQGSSADVIGAYFGDRDQVLDYRYVMHHAGVNTRSNMFLKGAVEDDALSVFTGMIRIDEAAQRTDAYQTNRNLILSEGAAAQSVPNLEILANDVKCGHGSTVGPLDEEQRYYLMSRGLDPARADRLQVRGFFEEALAKFPTAGITEPLRDWINAKFIEAQEEGRV